MKLKYNKETVTYSILLTIIVIVDSDFFGIIDLPSGLDFVIYQNRSKWVAPVAVLCGLICWRRHRNAFRPYAGFLKKYLCAVTLSVLILFFDALIRYPLNPLITTYGFGTVYFYSFLAIPILYIFEMGGFDNVMKWLLRLAIIMYFVAVVQGLSYLYTGDIVWGELGDTVWLRNGKLRIGTGAFGTVMPMYAIYSLYNQRGNRLKNNKESLLLILLNIMYILFTGQGRVMLLTEALMLIALIYVGDGSKRKKVYSTSIIFIICTCILFSGVIPYLISTFSAFNSEYGGSTIARLGAWKYYFSCFLKNPLTAIGFAGDDSYYNLVHGNSGVYYQTVLVRYYYEDTGFIGLLAKTGIFSLVIFVWPFFRYIKMASYFLKHKTVKGGAFIVAIAIYLICCLPSIDLLAGGMVIAWPFLIAICEYTWKRHRNNTENLVSV